MIVKLLALLEREVRFRIKYKSIEYKDGFKHALDLTKEHLLVTGKANEIIQLKKRLIHSERERKIEKRLSKLNNDALRLQLEEERNKGRKQRNQLSKATAKLDERKDLANRQRQKISYILENNLIAEDEKLKRISNLLKSYNNGTTGTIELESVCKTEWWNDVQNT